MTYSDLDLAASRLVKIPKTRDRDFPPNKLLETCKRKVLQSHLQMLEEGKKVCKTTAF